MHPNKITRKENGVPVRLDVFEYLFRHAQRLPDKQFLRPINKHKYSSRSRHGVGETQNEKEINQMTLLDDADSDLHQQKLYQRALGLFNKIVVQDDEVTCSCENFCRFEKCEDSELFAFICLGESGYPKQHHAINFHACKDGYPQISSRLREKVLDLVGAGEADVDAPPQDPAKSLQELEWSYSQYISYVFVV